MRVIFAILIALLVVMLAMLVIDAVITVRAECQGNVSIKHTNLSGSVTLKIHQNNGDFCEVTLPNGVPCSVGDFYPACAG